MREIGTEQNMTMPATKTNTTGRKSLRILVAEDSPLNQQVVLKQLEKLGFQAEAVDDGSKVLEALARTDFDIILMDCQMPEINGYEATWQIREREQQQAADGATGHRIHIIAMTANTEADNRERCLESGMDDFINKPVQLPELEAALLRALADRATTKAMEDVIDPIIIASLRQLRTTGTPDPLADLIDLFLKEAPTHLEAIEQAINRNAMDSLARVISRASALKGSSGNLGARNLATLSDEIVQSARLGLLADALPVLDRAKEELGRVRAALERIKGQGAPEAES